MDKFNESPAFVSALSIVSDLAVRSGERSELAGQCSKLAVQAQAHVAILYGSVDVGSTVIREALKASGLKKETLNTLCKDGIAIAKHSDFKSMKTPEAILLAFGALELETASAVRKYVKGVKADKVADLAKAYAKLEVAEQDRFLTLVKAGRIEAEVKLAAVGA